MPSTTRPRLVTLLLAVIFACCAQSAPLLAQGPPDQGTTPGGWQGGGWQGGGRGMGIGMPGGGRGLMGTVTEAASDHYTIKTDQGDTYRVFFSVNTRILKQPAPRNQPPAPGTSSAQPAPRQPRDPADRPMPQEIKPTDIKAGDVIMAAGEADASKKTLGAVMIFQVDPERARQMREYQAQFGKTWLAGRITAIDETKITLEAITDHAPHSFLVDENTSFRKRRDSITLADIKVGDQIRVEGAVAAGTFTATLVQAIEPRNPNGAATQPGPQN